MREVSIKELYRDLSREMDNLPFAVTKNGKVIGYMLSQIVKGLDKTSIGSDTPNGKGLDNKDEIQESSPRPQKGLDQAIKKLKAVPAKSLTGFSGSYSKEQQTGKK